MAGIEDEILIDQPGRGILTKSLTRATSHSKSAHSPGGEDHPGPAGTGTQFRSAAASMGRTAEMLIECTGYDRPTLLASTTTMAQADISYLLTFEPPAAGTRMRWSGQVRPKGFFRLLGPVISWLGIRQERRIWASLKQHLEAAPQPSA
jgi:hypothetical protein